MRLTHLATKAAKAFPIPADMNSGDLMGSVASTNPLASNNNNGLADLLQNLTNENSPL
jgi:hypothetical protein